VGQRKERRKVETEKGRKGEKEKIAESKREEKDENQEGRRERKNVTCFNKRLSSSNKV
jgi:hypothetical protein